MLYINGKPYVVRESSDPFHNLEYTGASYSAPSPASIVSNARMNGLSRFACCEHWFCSDKDCLEAST